MICLVQDKKRERVRKHKPIVINGKSIAAQLMQLCRDVIKQGLRYSQRVHVQAKKTEVGKGVLHLTRHPQKMITE